MFKLILLHNCTCTIPILNAHYFLLETVPSLRVLVPVVPEVVELVLESSGPVLGVLDFLPQPLVLTLSCPSCSINLVQFLKLVKNR